MLGAIQFQQVKVENWKIRKKKKNSFYLSHKLQLKSNLLRLTHLLCVTKNKPHLLSLCLYLIDEEKPH